MRTLPATMIQILSPFAPLFSKRLFQHAQVLLAGAILAPGRRTVSSALRALGLDQQERFHRYHQILSRATWSPTKASRILLGALVQTFAPEGAPLVVGIDETLERRRGRKIAAKGVYRDPVRSTQKEERTVETVSDTAVWHSTGLPAVPLRWVLIRDPQGEFRTQALLCTDLQADPERIICWFVRRWQMETTFQDVRQRLGFETQRHWSQRAIQRTAPALLALFSVVTLFAHQHMSKSMQTVRQTAWYRKSYPTFSDALALVRKELWA